jgi:large subunit ribosomal protein L23
MMGVLFFPVATEKALGKVDYGNIITYVVDTRATKAQIRKEFEETFGVKVAKVNTGISIKNSKKAYITLRKEYRAEELAKKLKLV